MRLEDLAGRVVKLRRQGNELRGMCPLCKASPHTGSVFKVDPSTGKWHCFACEKHGDVVDLHAALERMTLAEAARDLAGPAPKQSTPVVPRETGISDSDAKRAERIRALAGAMLARSRPIDGTLGARYLIGRGIDPEIVTQLDGPRFCADCEHSWNAQANVWRRAPAIVCRVVTPGGWTGGVHATYLDPAGGKSALSPGKLMWGPQGEETAIGKRRGGTWLIGSFPDDGELVIGEGIESALGLASWLWRQGQRDMGVAAALSLGGLQGVLRRDGDGCVDLMRPRPDAASPAFIWPPCNTGDDRKPGVLIAIDRDMSPVRVKQRTKRGRIGEFELDAEARANLCARLAGQAWRAAGWTATPMFPDPNGDWADKIAPRASPATAMGSL